MSKELPVYKSVLEKIEHDALIPTPAWHFVLRDCGIALLWIVSVLLGAVAVAVSLFVFSYQRFALFEATHESWLALWSDSLPFLWLGVLAVGLLLAARHQRHFRFGYRYSLWLLLGSSAAASVLFGILLHQANVGFIVDRMIGQHMPLYHSQAKIERGLWQQPQAGRLVGTQVFTTLATTSTIIFEDSTGRRWQTDTSELLPVDIELLQSGEQVRLLGLLKNDLVYSFHACGAFPWMADAPMTGSQLRTERKSFIERVYRHDTTPLERKQVLEAIVATRANESSKGRCRELPAITRMHKTMR